MFTWFSKGVKELYHRYKKQARDRGIPFELSKESFTGFVLSDKCRYCECNPFQYSNGTIILGIDREDNNLGYTDDNCVPCCKNCNRRKGTKSVDEFLSILYP